MGLREISISEYSSSLGTDNELAEKLRNFNDHIMEQKRDRSTGDNMLQDLEEDISKLRSDHMAKVGEHGKLAAEAKVSIHATFRISIFNYSKGERGSFTRARRDDQGAECKIPNQRL